MCENPNRPGGPWWTAYTYAEARQNLASLLDEAVREGEVRIRRRDGRVFVIKPQEGAGSPLDVERVDLGVTTAEIVHLVREGHERLVPPGEAVLQVGRHRFLRLVG